MAPIWKADKTPGDDDDRPASGTARSSGGGLRGSDSGGGEDVEAEGGGGAEAGGDHADGGLRAIESGGVPPGAGVDETDLIRSEWDIEKEAGGGGAGRDGGGGRGQEEEEEESEVRLGRTLFHARWLVRAVPPLERVSLSIAARFEIPRTQQAHILRKLQQYMHACLARSIVFLILGAL